jgi:hypothetical protein
MPIELRVDSCQLELSSDQSLQLAALQTIYPGAIGLTYRLADGSKCSVPFDGKAFTTPKEGWASDFYTVNLSGYPNGMCFSTVFFFRTNVQSNSGNLLPNAEFKVRLNRLFLVGGQNTFFESYQNACKQLERTVSTIHRLMSQQGSNNEELILNGYHGSVEVCNSNYSFLEEKLSPKLFNGKPNVRERHGSFRSQVATFKSSLESNNNRLDLWLPHKDSDELERQFSELSSILVGKNAIIEVKFEFV